MIGKISLKGEVLGVVLIIKLHHFIGKLVLLDRNLLEYKKYSTYHLGTYIADYGILMK